VVTASWDHTARVWDAASGKPLSPALAHQDKVHGAAFDPEGARVVTTSNDRTARVWSVPLASGTLDEWRATIERVSTYVLTNGVLSPRTWSEVPDPRYKTTVQSAPPRRSE